MKRRLAVVFSACAAAGCGGRLSEAPLDGDYVRGAFHLYLFCPGQSPAYRALDLLYPANGAGQTWRFAQSGHELSVTWAGVPIASGRRTTDGVELSLERLDPWSEPVDWQFHGRVRDDLRFHARTVVGRVESGTHEGCAVLPRSVAWFTAGERRPGEPLDPEARASARGAWGRFVWFLDIGPYGMSRKGDPGQRGRNLRLFSFAATGGGQITTGEDAAFFDNGFGSAWLGAAEGRSATFEQPEEYWDLDYRQDVLWDDDDPAGWVGIRRVLSGFVGGRYRILEQNYPPGWDGETGMLPLKSAGMAFWLDLVRAEPPAPEAAPAAGAVVISREEREGEHPPLRLRVEDGAVSW